jgi:hypothetical protein
VGRPGMARFAPGWFGGDALAGLFPFEDIALGVVARAVACTRARRRCYVEEKGGHSFRELTRGKCR